MKAIKCDSLILETTDCSFMAYSKIYWLLWNNSPLCLASKFSYQCKIYLGTVKYDHLRGSVLIRIK